MRAIPVSYAVCSPTLEEQSGKQVGLYIFLPPGQNNFSSSTTSFTTAPALAFATKSTLPSPSIYQHETRRSWQDLNPRACRLPPIIRRRCHRLQASWVRAFLWLRLHPDPMSGAHRWCRLPARNLQRSVQRLAGSDDHPGLYWAFSSAFGNTRLARSLVRQPTITIVMQTANQTTAPTR